MRITVFQKIDETLSFSVDSTKKPNVIYFLEDCNLTNPASMLFRS